MKKLNLLLQFRFRIVYAAISVLITILIMSDYWYVILAIPYMYYIYRNHRDLLVVIVVLPLLYTSIYMVKSNNTIEVAAQYEVIVTKVFQKDDYTSLHCNVNGETVNVVLSDIMEIRPGDLYRVKGELVTPNGETIPGNFNYKNYLLSKNIKYQIFVDDYEYIGSEFNLGIIGYKIDQYIHEKIPLSKSYVKTFILADKSEFDHELLNEINILGISHLFAVSGLHVGLLVMALNYLMGSVIKKKMYIEIMISILLVIYMIITSFSPSVVRASLVYVFLVLNKNTGDKLSNLDILSIVFVLTLLFNPFYFFNPGFALSFLVAIFLILNSKLLRKGSTVEVLFKVGYVSFLCSLPVILSLNYKINMLTLIMGILFILYMTHIILPLSYIVFVFPFLDKLLYLFITVYNKLIHIFSNISIFLIYGNFIHMVDYIVFYILIMSYLGNIDKIHIRNRKLLYLLIFCFIALNSNYYEIRKSVSFLDVEGDATLITDSFDRCNILIDTGESDPYDSVVNYMRSKNIKTLDYLVISHFHSDHYGEMSDILDKFNVENLITPDNVEMYHDSQISCGSFDLYIYDLSVLNQNENNNSIILSLYVEDKHYLFTGDTETSREDEFLSKYNIDIDYLKVAHHGSSTSSTESFIDSVSPEEVFIMVYRYNKYEHPDYFVINRFESRNIIVHRTDLMGTIEVEYYFGYERKKYNKP